MNTQNARIENAIKLAKGLKATLTKSGDWLWIYAGPGEKVPGFNYSTVRSAWFQKPDVIGTVLYSPKN